MKGSHPRPADLCPFVLRHSISQVTNFMQLGVLWNQVQSFLQSPRYMYAMIRSNYIQSCAIKLHMTKTQSLLHIKSKCRATVTCQIRVKPNLNTVRNMKLKLIDPECHIYASAPVATLGSDDGLSPVWCKAIIWPDAELLLMEPLGTSFSEISLKTQNKTGPFKNFFQENAFENVVCGMVDSSSRRTNQ